MQDTFHVGADTLLRTHTSPVQIRTMKAPAAARARSSARAGVPPRRRRRHALADVPPGRGARGGPPHHDGRPQGHARALRPRDVRAALADALPAVVLPVHRALGGGRRALLHVRRRRAAGSASSRGWLEILGSGHGASQRAAQRAATIPKRSPAGPSAWASSAIAILKYEHRRHPSVLRERPALPAAVRVRAGAHEDLRTAGCASSSTLDLTAAAGRRPPDQRGRRGGQRDARRRRGSRGVVVGEIEAIERELGDGATGHRVPPLPREHRPRALLGGVRRAQRGASGLRAAFAPPGATLPGGRADRRGQDPRRGVARACSARSASSGSARSTRPASCCSTAGRAARRRPRRPTSGLDDHDPRDRDHAQPAGLPVGGRRGPRAVAR